MINVPQPTTLDKLFFTKNFRHNRVTPLTHTLWRVVSKMRNWNLIG